MTNMLYEQLFTVGIARIIEVQYFAVECHVVDVMWLYYSTVECKQFIHAAAALLLVLSRSARDWVGRGCC